MTESTIHDGTQKSKKTIAPRLMRWLRMVVPLLVVAAIVRLGCWVEVAFSTSGAETPITHQTFTQGFIEHPTGGIALAGTTLQFHSRHRWQRTLRGGRILRSVSQHVVEVDSNGSFDPGELLETIDYNRLADLSCSLLPMKRDRWTISHIARDELTRVSIAPRLQRFEPASAKITFDTNTGTLSVEPPAWGDVHIQVVDPDGQPLDRGIVHVYAASHPFNHNDTIRLIGETDDAGIIQLRWWVGVHRLAIRVPGVGLGSTGWFEVLSGQTTDVSLPPLARFGTVEGHVECADIRRLNPLTIGRAMWHRSTSRVRHDGSFTFLDVIPGQQEIQHLEWTREGHSTTTGNTRVSVEPGRSMTGITFKIKQQLVNRQARPGEVPSDAELPHIIQPPIVHATATITGVVRDADGRPLADQPVVVFNSLAGMNSKERSPYTTTTDNKGSYTVTSLHANPEGKHSTGFWFNSARRSGNRVVMVARPGHPPTSITISHSQFERSTYRKAETEQNGSVDELVSKEVAVRDVYNEVLHYRADITVPRTGGVLDVLILENGRPAPGAVVQLRSEDRSAEPVAKWYPGFDARPEEVAEFIASHNPITRTDKQGRVRFEHLVPGEYRLLAANGLNDESLANVIRNTRDDRPFLSADFSAVSINVNVVQGESRQLRIALQPQPAPRNVLVHDVGGNRLMTTGQVTRTMGLAGPAGSNDNVVAEDLLIKPWSRGLWFLTLRSRRSGIRLDDYRRGSHFEATGRVAMSPLLGRRPVRVTAHYYDTSHQPLTVRIVDQNKQPVDGTITVEDGSDAVADYAASTQDGRAVFHGLPIDDQMTVRGYLAESREAPWPTKALSDDQLTNRLRLRHSRGITISRSHPVEIQLPADSVGYVRCHVQLPDGASPGDYHFSSGEPQFMVSGGSPERFHGQFFDPSSSTLLCGPCLQSSIPIRVIQSVDNQVIEVARTDVTIHHGQVVHCEIAVQSDNPAVKDTESSLSADTVATLESTSRFAQQSRKPETAVDETQREKLFHGRIVHSDGSPAWRAHVFTCEAANQFRLAPLATTKSDGRFVVPATHVSGLVEKYKKLVENPPEDGLPRAPCIVAYLPASNGLTIAPIPDDLAKPVEITLEPKRRVRGRVTVSARSPERLGTTVRVVARFLGDENLVRIASHKTTASVDGTFLLAGLTKGAYEVQASLDGIWLSETIRLNVPDGVKGLSLRNLTLPVAKPGGTTFIQLLDNNGEPLRHRQVIVAWPVGPIADELHASPLQTDALGIVRIDGCTAGRQTLQIAGFDDVVTFDVPSYDNPQDSIQTARLKTRTSNDQ